MHISDSILDLVIKRCIFEYSGVHSSNGWPGRAYWRAYVPEVGFVCKIVSGPLKSKNPKQSTLDKALKAELKRRFHNVQVVVDTNHYGEVSSPRIIDPHSVLGLFKVVEGKYMDLMLKGKQ